MTNFFRPFALLTAPFFVLALAWGAPVPASAQTPPPPPAGKNAPDRPAADKKGPGPQKGPQKAPDDRPPPPADRPAAEAYSVEQAVSWQAQLSTYAFSGLAFLTGTFGADTFLPPGKVADYFGFQYLRDIDAQEAGHNNKFLGQIANNVLAVFDAKQRAQLTALAAQQEPLYNQYADKRLPVILAFRTSLEGKAPAGTVLSEKAAQAALADLWALDGRICAERATVYGQLAASLSDAQKAALGKLKFGDSATWPDQPEPSERRGLGHNQDVLFMTYASEFFSWYAGSETADVYFCPERHATYFGGFYMKDYPAMGNNDYYIPTALTGDAGKDFVGLLTADQAQPLLSLEKEVGTLMTQIVDLRTAISRLFRGTLKGTAFDPARVIALSRTYGELDGRLSYLLAQAFTGIHKTLTADQKAALVKLRNQDVFPDGLYRYSDPIPVPARLDVSGFFAKAGS